MILYYFMEILPRYLIPKSGRIVTSGLTPIMDTNSKRHLKIYSVLQKGSSTQEPSYRRLVKPNQLACQNPKVSQVDRCIGLRGHPFMTSTRRGVRVLPSILCPHETDPPL